MASTPICAQLLGLYAAILSLLRPYGCTGVTEDAVIQRWAEVGGRVWMDCDAQDYKYLYWQKEGSVSGPTFINGLTTSHSPIVVGEEYINRTRVYSNGTLELWNLELSDSTKYRCEKVIEVGSTPVYIYHLIVTARYAKPVLTTDSSGDGLLDVTCSSWGGSPRRDVQWHVHGELNSSSLWDMSQNMETTDLLWNVTGTAKLNCTERLRISCTVGNVTSEELEICKQLPPFTPVVIIAIVVVTVLVLGMLLACIAQIFKRFCQNSSEQREHAEELPLRTTPSSEAEMSSSSHVEGPREPV